MAFRPLNSFPTQSGFSPGPATTNPPPRCLPKRRNLFHPPQNINVPKVVSCSQRGSQRCAASRACQLVKQQLPADNPPLKERN